MPSRRIPPNPSGSRAIPAADLGLRLQIRDQHAFEALSLMRHGRSLRQAAREVGESPATVLRRVGAALRRDPSGRWVARPTDQLVRPMEILTREGKVAVMVRGSKAASLVATHWNAIKDELQGRPGALRHFRGLTIKFLTDPRRVRELADAGELSFETIYSITG
jgi:hypothetical protein